MHATERVRWTWDAARRFCGCEATLNELLTEHSYAVYTLHSTALQMQSVLREVGYWAGGGGGPGVHPCDPALRVFCRWPARARAPPCMPPCSATCWSTWRVLAWDPRTRASSSLTWRTADREERERDQKGRCRFSGGGGFRSGWQRRRRNLGDAGAQARRAPACGVVGFTPPNAQAREAFAAPVAEVIWQGLEDGGHVAQGRQVFGHQRQVDGKGRAAWCMATPGAL